MRQIFNSGLVAAVLFAAASAVSAATIVAQSEGVQNPDGFVGFGEVDIADDDRFITDQFEDFGVRFDPGVSLFTNNPRRANFEGNFSGNFRFGDSGLENLNPLSIIFTQTVSAASFASTNNNNNTTVFSAFLGDQLVEQFTTNVVRPGVAITNNIYGFSGIFFDRIQMEVISGNRTAGVDSIAFDIAPVPLPASLPVMLVGLGGFAVLSRRRRKTPG
ncbi:VPLPA-CTERM sorting domain-containing protein [uncultured Roseobacter sp.]|uniref:VPLPA-CTERM sorting domain-containing protein n=1 Tax=uncultured Roseobacter sp. TaxID=114847 RepID=UPI00261AB5F6|nr:VPLPA-CTERM sorting domain-containing protein [uncultured Roseobacter sp.]